MDLIVAGIGLLGGFVAGLLGVGGGLIFVPLLTVFRGLDVHQAVGTSMMIIIFTAVFGAFFHHRAGMVDIKIAVVMGLFSILGVWLGTRLSVAVDAGTLRKIFAVFLAVMAGKFFFMK